MTITRENNPNMYLYVLVRTDMDSLGRGKSVAQGAHAANQFTYDSIIHPLVNNEPLDADAMSWSRSAGGFGTTIALAATLKEMEHAVLLAKALGHRAALVADPEYPLLDGATLHLLPNVVTTAYVFGDKNALKIVLGDLPLLRNDPVPR